MDTDVCPRSPRAGASACRAERMPPSRVPERQVRRALLRDRDHGLGEQQMHWTTDGAPDMGAAAERVGQTARRTVGSWSFEVAA